MNRWFKAAIACALLPMATGVAIFALWLAVRWEWLMVAGLFTIFGGCVFFLAGCGCLAMYCRTASDVTPQKQAVASTIIGAAILLSNFPIAAGIVVAAELMYTCYSVVIDNESGKPLDRARLCGGGVCRDIGVIPAGDKSRASLWFQGDGRVEFHATCGDAPILQTVDEYVTGYMGGHAVVTVHRDRTVSVVNDRPK